MSTPTNDLVVLGLAVQFLPQVITETFLIALLTAILLKVVLEVVLVAKKAVVSGIRTAPSAWRRTVSIMMLVTLLPGLIVESWVLRRVVGCGATTRVGIPDSRTRHADAWGASGCCAPRRRTGPLSGPRSSSVREGGVVPTASSTRRLRRRAEPLAAWAHPSVQLPASIDE
jgi:hypothetical protein